VRARQMGIVVGEMEAGSNNGITDVPGVRVGHTTLVRGDGPLEIGRGPVRTGVTVIVPHERVGTALLFAGAHRLNGNGELTGLEWVRESGLLSSPVAITNTHSVGVVRDALIAYQVRSRSGHESWWSLPVVGETWDGVLNDVNGQHVEPEHVWDALEGASDGPVVEGNAGGGTGMICHGFKGGIGTSSRILPGIGGYTVGVLVQANHGRRSRLSVNGVPVGREIPASEVPVPRPPAPVGTGSIIVVVGTDAPLLPHQCERLAQRAGLAVARVGGAGEHSSGDLFLAFSTGNADRGEDGSDPPTPTLLHLQALSDVRITELFYAVIEATEEAIVNALLAAETMTGRDGHIAHRLDPERLTEIMRRYGREPQIAER
jgi:D-aminopeptidase